MRLWNWDVVMFITLITVVVVMMIWIKVSSMLRNKYTSAKISRCIGKKSNRLKPLADPILPHIQGVRPYRSYPGAASLLAAFAR